MAKDISLKVQEEKVTTVLYNPQGQISILLNLCHMQRDTLVIVYVTPSVHDSSHRAREPVPASISRTIIVQQRTKDQSTQHETGVVHVCGSGCWCGWKAKDDKHEGHPKHCDD